MKSFKVIILIFLSGAFFFVLGYYLGSNNLRNEIEGVTKQLKEKEDLIEQQNIQAEKEEYSHNSSIQLQYCNKATAKENLKYWLASYYPDWEVITDIKVIDAGDCKYNLRFTAINPHFIKFGMKEKEVIVVQLSYSENFKQFSVLPIRGQIY